jgi:hypothetical protein
VRDDDGNDDGARYGRPGGDVSKLSNRLKKTKTEKKKKRSVSRFVDVVVQELRTTLKAKTTKRVVSTRARSSRPCSLSVALLPSSPFSRGGPPKGER